MTNSNFSLSTILCFLTTFPMLTAGKVCVCGNQRNSKGEMLWIFDDKPETCDVILPGGYKDAKIPEDTTTLWKSNNPRFTNVEEEYRSPSLLCPNVSTDAHNDYTAIVTSGVSCADHHGNIIEASCSHGSNHEYPIGDTLVVCSCKDAFNGRSQCSFIVTVHDVTSPLLLCNNSSNVTKENGTSSVKFNLSCVDNIDGIITPSCDHQSDFLFPIGETTVTCWCTDRSNNKENCSFIATVSDVTPPVVHCEDVTSISENGNTSVVFYEVICSDNSGDVSQPSCNIQSGSEFPAGYSYVTCSCVDESNNVAECSFTVFVYDVTGPDIFCNDIDHYIAFGNMSIVHFYAFCHDTNGNSKDPWCSIESGSSFPIGDTNVSCTCTDETNNTSQCVFTVSVRDVTPPTIFCEDILSVIRHGSTSVVFYNVSCDDNTGDNTDLSCDVQSGSTFQIGDTYVTCSCVDRAKNTEECSFTVSVNDATPPGIFCDNVNYVASDGRATTAYFHVYCFDYYYDDYNDTPLCDIQSGSQFPIGNTTVTCSCVDDANNSAVCVFTVSVFDISPPFISCENVFTETEHESTSVVYYDVLCYDNSDEVIYPSCNLRSGSEFPVGDTLVNCSCVDESKNEENCSFVVSVYDANSLHISCEDVLYVSYNNESTVYFEAFCYNDAGSGVPISCDHQPEFSFPIGDTEVTCSCTDASNYKKECSFTVSAKDIAPPSLLCHDVFNETGQDNTTSVFFNIICQDESGDVINLSCDHDSGSHFPIGNTHVTCWCNDTSYNSAECIFNVTVYDKKSPIATCEFSEDFVEGSSYLLLSVTCEDNSQEIIQPECDVDFAVNFYFSSRDITCTCTDASWNSDYCIFEASPGDVTGSGSYGETWLHWTGITVVDGVPSTIVLELDVVQSLCTYSICATVVLTNYLNISKMISCECENQPSVFNMTVKDSWTPCTDYGSQYRFINNKTSWLNAFDNCNAYSGFTHLVKIESDTEQETLLSLFNLTSAYSWLLQDEEVVYQWNVTSRSWSKSFGSQFVINDCSVFSFNNAVLSQPCWYTLPFICENEA